MNYLLLFTAFVLTLSKFLDCLTTSQGITHLHQEQNYLARKMMIRLGMQNTIWGVFLLSIIIIVSPILYHYFEPLPFWYLILYILLGLAISVIQFAVAHTNYYKKLNYFTRLLLQLKNYKL